MQLSWYTYKLVFKHPFSIAHGTRSYTDTVFVEIEHEGVVGYGEATLPPYLPENIHTVQAFLQRVNLKNTVFDLNQILIDIDQIAPGNTAAKAAIDMALHDLWGKLNRISLFNHWRLSNQQQPLCTFTIGMCSPDELTVKLQEAKDFNLFKIKLDGKRDKDFILAFKQQCDKPFCVDLNQGWDNKEHALESIYWLQEKGAILVEQPLSKDLWDEHAWLSARSPLPVIADEAVQRLTDMDWAISSYHGINIKLTKCTGLHEGRKMVQKAKEHQMKLLIGCMSESSCAVTAAAHLAPFCDWADLDGPYLIKNDPFEGMKIMHGRVFIPENLGLSFKKLY